MAKNKKRPVWEMGYYGNVQTPPRGVPATGTAALPSGLPTGISTAQAAAPAPGTGSAPAPDPSVPIRPTPEIQAQAQSILADPQSVTAIGNKSLADSGKDVVGNVIQGGASILGNLFNTEDESDLNVAGVNLSGVESVWDGFLKGVGWGYDTINQAGSWANSAAPGGIDTFEWDQAGDISWGQSAIAANSALINDLGPAGAVIGAVMNPLGAPAAMLGESTDQLYAKDNFDVTDPLQRKAAFEDSTVGKWASGLTDAVPTIFADPLIFGGKALKITRIKYLDNPLRYAANRVDRINELKAGFVAAEGGQLTGHAPAVQTLLDMEKIDITTGRTMSAREIEKRIEIADSTNSAGVASALEHAPDRETRFLIMRHAMLDTDATAELVEKQVETAARLLEAQLDQFKLTALVDPDKAKINLGHATVAAEKATAEREAMQAMFDAGQVPESFVLDAVAKETERLRVADAFQRTGGNDWMGGTDEATRYMVDEIAVKALAKDEYAQRALSDNIAGSLVTAEKGFSSNTRLGRAVSARRGRQARAAYEWQMTSKSGFHADVFGNKGLKRTLMVLRHWGSTINAAYYVHTGGTGAMDSATEVGAVVDGLKMYAGKGVNKVLPDGQSILVGGVDAKNRIVDEYVQSINDIAASKTVTDHILGFETGRIITDMADFYNVSADALQAIVVRMKAERAGLADSIKNRMFFASSDTELARAPFLESQLQEGMYILPFDELEKMLIRTLKEESTNPTMAAFLKSGEVAGKHMGDFYSTFQDLWRPAVLMRFGYTQRNVTEGLFRSMAYNSSLAPLAWAGKAGLYGVTNIRRGKAVARQVPGLKRAIAAPDAERDAFDALVQEATTRGMHQQDLLRIKGLMEGAPVYSTGPYMVPAWRDITNGVRQTEDGTFQIVRDSRVIDKPEAAASFTKTEAGYVSNTGVEIVKEGRKWKIGDTTYPTLKAAREAVGPSPASTSSVERFTMWEAADDGKFVPSDRKFSTLADAEKGVNDAVAQAQAKTAPDYVANPQLRKIREEYGPNAPKPENVKYLDEFDREYTNLAEVDAALKENLAGLDKAAAAMDGFNGRPIAQGLKGTKFEKWRVKQQAALQAKIDDSVAFEESFLADLGTDSMTAVQEANLFQLRRWRMDDEATLLSIERDDMFALTEYQSRATAKRGLAMGSRQYKGVTLYDAYGNPRYAQIARQNLSADNTVKATMSMRMQLSESMWLNKKAKDFIELAPPGMKNVDGSITSVDQYFTSLELYLRQFTQSRIGQDALRGVDSKITAAWLLHDPQGQKIVDALEKMVDREIGTSIEQAAEYVDNIKRGLYQVTTGNASVMEIMAREPISAKKLKELIGDNPNLVNIVGHSDELIGFKSGMEAWRAFTQKMFHFIGTLPEDTFVRAPFYAKRYADSQEIMLKALEKEFGDADSIPFDRIQWVETQAHRRALQDTKKWLYTIDRRTNLGKYGEALFPFISATQNSVTALGRLTMRDPALPGMMLALWRMPEKVGWEDDQGNLVIPLPHGLIPDGVEDALGITGMSDIRIGKSQLNVIFPETGFAFVPRPTPLMQIPASELMKNGWFGQSVEAPSLLVNALGKDGADQLWGTWKDYLFGEENGISPEFASLDKVLPPVANKFVQMLQGDSSSQYAFQYALQARSEDLRWRAGERDDYPTSNEIIQRTNGLFGLRMMGNLFAFTPPTYTSAIQPLIDMQRKYDEAYGLDGPMKFSQTFGNEALIIANTDTTKNTGGSLSTMDSVRNIRANEELIRSISPNIGSDLSVLGIIANGDQATAAYDASAYRWLSETKIPGRSDNWRNLLSGPEALAESQRTAGWVEYMKFTAQLDAMLADQKLPSYRVKAAGQLVEYRKTFLDNMLNNPMYAGWANDFKSMGSTKVFSAVTVITAALGNQKFMEAHTDDPTWQVAAEYIQGRAEYAAAVKASGHGIDVESNQELADSWEAFRQNLINRDEGWAAIANRYLLNDNDPEKVGTPSATLGGN